MYLAAIPINTIECKTLVPADHSPLPSMRPHRPHRTLTARVPASSLRLPPSAVNWPHPNKLGYAPPIPRTNHTPPLPCRGSAIARTRCTVFTGHHSPPQPSPYKHTALPLPCLNTRPIMPPRHASSRRRCDGEVIGGEMGAKSHRSIGGEGGGTQLPHTQSAHRTARQPQPPNSIYQGLPGRCVVRC